MPKAAMTTRQYCLQYCQLIDLFLEDDKKLFLSFLRMKIKVALGGVIHPISPKKLILAMIACLLMA